MELPRDVLLATVDASVLWCGHLMWALFNWTPILEWYMSRVVGKNAHPKDTCHNVSGLYCLKYKCHSAVNAVEKPYVST
jgi:hypothetical protein